MPPRNRGGGKKIGRRILGGAILVAVGIFAVQGGEWGTFDLLRQRTHLDRLSHDVDSLRHEVDSLKKYEKRLETDPALQERIAREEFGMVKGDRELIYR